MGRILILRDIRCLLHYQHLSPVGGDADCLVGHTGGGGVSEVTRPKKEKTVLFYNRSEHPQASGKTSLPCHKLIHSGEVKGDSYPRQRRVKSLPVMFEIGRFIVMRVCFLASHLP